MQFSTSWDRVHPHCHQQRQPRGLPRSASSGLHPRELQTPSRGHQHRDKQRWNHCPSTGCPRAAHCLLRATWHALPGSIHGELILEWKDLLKFTLWPPESHHRARSPSVSNLPLLTWGTTRQQRAGGEAEPRGAPTRVGGGGEQGLALERGSQVQGQPEVEGSRERGH